MKNHAFCFRIPHSVHNCICICLTQQLHNLLVAGTSTLVEEKVYTIYIASTPGNFSVLNGSMTLEQVNEKYWKVNRPLEMYYAQQKKKEEKWQNLPERLDMHNSFNQQTNADQFFSSVYTWEDIQWQFTNICGLLYRSPAVMFRFCFSTALRGEAFVKSPCCPAIMSVIVSSDLEMWSGQLDHVNLDVLYILFDIMEYLR